MRPVLPALAVVLLAVGPTSAFDGWRLKSVQSLASQGSSWDYLHLDPTGQRLFIGNRKEGLKVYDLVTKTIIKVIEGTDRASSNGVTFAPEFDIGISNNQDGTITPFKLSTLEASAPIKLSDEIDNSHYDPVTKRLIVNVAPGKDGTELAVLELPSLKVVGAIKVPTVKPEHADFDGSGGMFLAARDTDTVYRIDVGKMTVTAAWSTLPACARTNSLVYDGVERRILLGCRGSEAAKPSFAVMDAVTGKVVYAAEIGGGVDGIAFDPGTRRVFLSGGVNAVINVFEQRSADSYNPIEALGTEAGARTIAYDPGKQLIYSVTAEGTADFSKKITTSVSPFYANTFYKDTFKVLTYGK